MPVDISQFNIKKLSLLLDENKIQTAKTQWQAERKVFESKLKNTDVFRQYTFDEGQLTDGLVLTLVGQLWCVAYLQSGKNTHCAYFAEHSTALRYLFLRVTKRAYHAVNEA